MSAVVPLIAVASEEKSSPGALVVVPVAPGATTDATPSTGAMVAAPMAPETGNVGVSAGGTVAVRVIHWAKSSEIWASVGVVLAGGADGMINVALPLLTDPSVSLQSLKGPAIRAFIIAALGAYQGLRRKTSNRVVE